MEELYLKSTRLNGFRLTMKSLHCFSCSTTFIISKGSSTPISPPQISEVDLMLHCETLVYSVSFLPFAHKRAKQTKEAYDNPILSIVKS